MSDNELLYTISNSSSMFSEPQSKDNNTQSSNSNEDNSSEVFSSLATNPLLRKAIQGEKGACLELSKRYKEGTRLLSKDDKLSIFWENVANGVKSPIKDHLYVLDNTRFFVNASIKDLLECVHYNSPLVCLELSRRYRKNQQKEAGDKWYNKAIQIIENIENDSFGNNSTQEEIILSVEEYFKKNLSNWFGETVDFGGDCSTYLQHEKMNCVLLPSFRNNFGISLDEVILFTRDTSFWSNSNQGLVITEKAIYAIGDNDHPEDEVIVSWTDIDHVVYKEYTFYFYNNTGEELASIGSNYFFKNIDIEKLEKHGIGEKLAGHFTQMAKLAGDTVGIYDTVLGLEEGEKYDEAIKQLDLLMANPTIEEDYISHFLKGRILLKKEWTIDDKGDEKRFNLIEKELLKAAGDSDDPNYSIYCDYWRAYNFLTYGNFLAARSLFMSAMKADSEEMREDSKEQFELTEEKLTDVWNNYTSEYQYKDRKFLMPIKDNQIAGCNISGIDTFRLSNIPSCIKFPMGHPIPNELYIGHPFKPELYVPYEDSEDIFFVDKIHELCYLLECLGAEEIAITAIKGRNVSEMGNFDIKMAANADIRLTSLSGDLKDSGNFEKNQSSNIQRTLRQRFDPMKKPFLPEGLIWYPEQTKWQRLVNSRLNGNLLEYNEFVSTTDTKFVSEAEKSSIKASAEYLWNNIDGNVETNSNSQFKEAIETQWKVEVKFRSIKDFENVNSFSIHADVSNKPTKEQILSTLNSLLSEFKWNEAKDHCLKYIAEVDSLYVSLVGIYEHLNEYEKSLEAVGKVKKMEDYANSNSLKLCAAWGEYRAYYKLNDYKKAKPICEFFISIVPEDKTKRDGTNMKQEAQADLIEINKKISKFDSNEQEYLDNLKEFLEDDAEITPRERKMLDRIRQSLGISEERAKELEASLSQPKLTDDEQEYLDMYKEYAEEGEITEKMRRRLDKFASALGISEERKIDIENM